MITRRDEQEVVTDEHRHHVRHLHFSDGAGVQGYPLVMQFSSHKRQ